MKKTIEKTYCELYKDLERIVCKNLHMQSPRTANIISVADIPPVVSTKTQRESFHEAMRIPVISGQFAGLLPIVGVYEKEASRVRFTVRSLRFIYCCTMLLTQMTASCFCLYKIFQGEVTLRKLGNFSFYFSTCVTSFVFLHLATKWRYILEQVAASNLNEYVDPSIRFKCNCAAATLLGSAIIEHLLSLVARISLVRDCIELSNGHMTIVETMFNWTFHTNVTLSVPTGLLFLIVNFISTMNWGYSPAFIICISLYLTSILDQINKIINSNKSRMFPPSHWEKLRNDYDRAATLVREFDDVINSIIFFSFASNLLFVCLQLYNTMSNVMETFSNVTACPYYPSGPFYGFELLTYYVYSLFLLISRFLAVALVASRIHTASRAAAPSLYSVPSIRYCNEVERFIRQIHGSFVALSGLNFFYVTKELILSVVGTVVTYELVLLQLGEKQVTNYNK